MMNITVRCASIVAISVMLLGADPSPAPSVLPSTSDAVNQVPAASPLPGVNPDYMQFIGTWSCTKPGYGTSWTAMLNVQPAGGEIEFTERLTGSQASGADHFYLSEDPKTGEWSQRDPMQPWLRTGMMKNGVIIFADPKPNPGRYGLGISPNGQVLEMLPYNSDPAQQRLTYENLLIKCTKSAK